MLRLWESSRVYPLKAWLVGCPWGTVKHWSHLTSFVTPRPAKHYNRALLLNSRYFISYKIKFNLPSQLCDLFRCRFLSDENGEAKGTVGKTSLHGFESVEEIHEISSHG
jgi:hypothetical protein